MEKVIYETKIKNPNVNSKKEAFGILLLGTIIMVFAPLLDMRGWWILIFPLLAIVASFVLLNKKNATLMLFKQGNQGYLLKVEGKKIDFSLKGNFTYEVWRGLKHSRRWDMTHKVPYLSVRNGKDPEVLIQASNYNPKNNENWGVMKEASFNTIGILVELELAEMKQLIAIFEANTISQNITDKK